MSEAAPETIDELLRRARQISGLPLAKVARDLGRDMPPDLRRHKGWIGRLMEDVLGADAGNAPVADFHRLGVELKTIPVDRHGRVRESTFVCSVPQAQPDEVRWQTSHARAKLSKILWIPILDAPDLPLAHRVIGSPLLWSPTPYEEALLAQDWREHLEVIRQGLVDTITAHDGQVLQIRPKGARADSPAWGVDERGEAILTSPRAFYLRAQFTESLLRAHFSVDPASPDGT